MMTVGKAITAGMRLRDADQEGFVAQDAGTYREGDVLWVRNN